MKRKQPKQIPYNGTVCDICGERADYDARMRSGTWANLCEYHKDYADPQTLNIGYKFIHKQED